MFKANKTFEPNIVAQINYPNGVCPNGDIFSTNDQTVVAGWDDEVMMVLLASLSYNSNKVFFFFFESSNGFKSRSIVMINPWNTVRVFV